MTNEIEKSLSDNPQEKNKQELQEKSFSVEIHIDFKKDIEKEYNWKLNPKTTYTNDENSMLFTYEQVVSHLEKSSIYEFQKQLRGYLNNESIEVRHSKTNVGSISLILTIIDFLDNANKVVEFFENLGKVKKFAQKFFKSDVTNRYGDYFEVETNLIDDPNILDLKDKINHFLWFCAGAKIKYLKHCPTDHIKFANIGLTVFLTSFLSLLTSTYAAYSITHHQLSSICFGLFWAFLIFSLDRTIVSSITPDDKSNYIKIIPRFLLAITLALLISNPFELMVFNNRISKELISIEKQNELDFIKDKSNSTYINELKKQVLFYDKEINSRTKRITNLQDSLDSEIKGYSKTRKKGYGISAGNIEKTKLEVKAEITEYRELRKEPKDKLDSELNKIKEEAINFSTKNKGHEDIIEQNNALSIILKKESFAKFVYYLLFFALLLFEISPIIIKLSAKKGTYDNFIETLEKQNSKEHLDVIIQTQKNLSIEFNKLLMSLYSRFNELQEKAISVFVDNEKNERVVEYLRQQQLEVTKVITEKFKDLIRKISQGSS